MRRHIVSTLFWLLIVLISGSAALWGCSYFLSFNARLTENSIGNHILARDLFVWQGRLGYSNMDAIVEYPTIPPNPPRLSIARMPVDAVSIALDKLEYDLDHRHVAGIVVSGSPIQQVVVPMWMIFAILAIAQISVGIIYLRRRVRRKTGLCTSCGYNLTANTSGVCPECGNPVPARVLA